MSQSTVSLPDNNTSVGIWLLLCCLTIYAMIVLGGVTRLTGSGLSMVDWRPITGILPPLNDEQWRQTFDLYRESPQFKKINSHMDVADFKGIFWLEYFHRLLGRLIGLIFLLPLLYFSIRRRIDTQLARRLGGVFILGGLQGLMGWYMVKSGLVDDPRVSQYRLTAHLGLAFVIYGYLLWTALGLLLPVQRPVSARRFPGFRRLARTLPFVVLLTVLSGGFVAGLKAGLAYNTFPLMAGRLVPEGLLAMEPWWRNLFENITTVQFDHRVLAMLTAVLVLSLWLSGRHGELAPRLRFALHLLLIALVLQVTLGISTLLLHVPIALAASHQAGAVALFTLSLFISHQLGRELADRPRQDAP